MKRLIASVIAITFTCLVACGADLNAVVDKALKGKQVKNVKVNKHKFHVKAITIVKGANGKVATGQISHNLGWGRPDDQVTYKVTVRKGEDTNYEIKIARGGLEQFLPIPDKWKGKTGKIIDGDWEPSCQTIIDVIAAKLEVE